MSTHNHHTKQHSENHGTVMNYVVGLLLSLTFTIIPYLLVVNKSLRGDVLLMTILGFAVLQMFIQIFYFLHLGRGPKPLYNIVFFFGTAGLIVVVVGASLFIMNNLYRNMAPDEVIRKVSQKEGISQVGGKPTGACTGNKDNYLITIIDGVARPIYVNARRCDTITFLNKDKTKREITFGTKYDQTSYGGEDKVILDDDRPETITLNQEGYFSFYDVLDPSLSGQFYVE